LKTKTTALLFLLLLVLGATGFAAESEVTNAVLTVESKPVFHRDSVGSVVDSSGNERDLQMVWLVLKRGQENIRILWETTTKRAPVMLDTNETYLFEIKTMKVGTQDVFYLHKVRKGDKVILQDWIP